MSQNIVNAFKKRRTIYALSDKLPQTKQEISDLIQTVIENAPSAFNSQTSRALILFGDAHRYLWSNITYNILKKKVGNGDFSSTANKIDGFAAGAGTVLFFEDQDQVESLKKNFPLYADAMDGFSLQSSGMAQYALWVAFAAEGIGASLQHYNPLIDDAVADHWDIPKSWKLLSQMVFGSIKKPAGEKDFISRDQRFKVAG